MKTEITAEEYHKLRADCKPYSSFSDPDGVLHYGYGEPAMDTDWGKDDITICRCEMRKKDRHQKDWDFKYFKYEPPFKSNDY